MRGECVVSRKGAVTFGAHTNFLPLMHQQRTPRQPSTSRQRHPSIPHSLLLRRCSSRRSILLLRRSLVILRLLLSSILLSVAWTVLSTSILRLRKLIASLSVFLVYVDPALAVPFCAPGVWWLWWASLLLLSAVLLALLLALALVVVGYAVYEFIEEGHCGWVLSNGARRK
jgi:hypothetical protein